MGCVLALMIGKKIKDDQTLEPKFFENKIVIVGTAPFLYSTKPELYKLPNVRIFVYSYLYQGELFIDPYICYRPLDDTSTKDTPLKDTSTKDTPLKDTSTNDEFYSYSPITYIVTTGNNSLNTILTNRMTYPEDFTQNNNYHNFVEYYKELHKLYNKNIRPE